MLNAATIAAIVAACWAHPSGVSYLEKIERLNACSTPNPCCQVVGLDALPIRVQRIVTLAKIALSPRGATYRPGGFARLGWREPKP